MSRGIWICMALLMIPIAGIAGEKSALDQFNSAFYAFDKSLKTAELDYRRAIAKAILGADKVEIYLLDFEPGETENLDSIIEMPKDQFPVVPYSRLTKILDRKTLNAQEMKLLLPALEENLSAEDPGAGALCHMPIHGIRVFSQGTEIFRTSLCYLCGNFYVEYPVRYPQWSRWLAMSNTTLESTMRRLLPIPQKQIDRIGEKYPTLKKRLEPEKPK